MALIFLAKSAKISGPFDSTMRREVNLHNGCPGLRAERRAVLSLIWKLDEHAGEFLKGCPAGELSIALLSDQALAKLHADFLDDPSATDVITFEGNSSLGVAGEICVSVETARAYAKKHRRDFSEELTLYLVHGWLHLAGYDDLAPPKKRQMRTAENRAMTILRNARCIPSFSVRPRH